MAAHIELRVIPCLLNELSQSFLSVQSERKEGRKEGRKGGLDEMYNDLTAEGIGGLTEEEDGSEDGKRRGEEWGVMREVWEIFFSLEFPRVVL